MEPENRGDEERVDLIDAEDQVIGQALRRDVRRENLLHRGVGILPFDAAGRIYVHRRTETKDVFPGLYDMFVGGVVASGEDYDSAARREIAEELGIVGPTPKRLGEYLYRGPHNHSLVAIYRVTWDGPIVHQAEEVAWGAWMEVAELEDRLAEWRFVPDGLEIWRWLCREGL